MRYLGYVKSALSPADLIFSSSAVRLPNSYDISNSLRPITDQGSTPKCVSVAVTEMIEFHMELDKVKPNFKDDYIFNLRSNKSQQGMTPKEALQIVKLLGVPSVSGDYKLNTFSRLEGIDNMKKAILANGPIIVGLPVFNYDTEFWRGTRLVGGHAINFVGWDSEGFILRNSWGLDYGRNGYSHFSYKDFNSIYEAWTIIN